MNKTKLFSVFIALLAVALTMPFVLSGCKKDTDKNASEKGTVVISEDEYGVEQDDNVVEDPFSDWDEDTTSAKTTASSKTGGGTTSGTASGTTSSAKSGETSKSSKTTTSKKQTTASKTTKQKTSTTNKNTPTETDDDLWTGYY